MTLPAEKREHRSDKYILWPEFKLNDEWSVPDLVWQYVWMLLLESGKARKTFYLGHVDTFKDFLAMMRTPGTIPVLVMNREGTEPIVLSWCSKYEEGVCNAHFVFLKGLPYPEIGRKVLAYWSSLPGMNVLVGVTPLHYEQAWKYALKIGFTKIGEIPAMCPMYYEGRRVPAVITHYLMKED